MSNESDLEKIELSIEQANVHIGKQAALQSLFSNKEFIEVFLKGYFETEPSRLVLLKADPAMQSAENQASIIQAIDAIGHFRQYINTIMQLGNMARKAVNDDQEAREEILAEG